MAKNKKVMSIAIAPDLHEVVKKYARHKRESVSEWMGKLATMATKLNIDDEVFMVGKPIDEDVKSVMVKIPVSYLSDEEALRAYMTKMTNGIVDKLLASEKAKQNESC